MRRLLLPIVVGIVATLGLGAPAASASVAITAEPASTCSEVTVSAHVVSGGCVVHAATSVTAPFVGRQHVPTMGEAVLTTCTSEFDARFHSSGQGFAYDQSFAGGGCAIAPCDEPAPGHANINWPMVLGEFTGVETLTMTFCARIGADPEGTAPLAGACTIAISWVNTTLHDYELDLPANVRRCSQTSTTSVSGTWHIESTPIEVTH